MTEKVEKVIWEPHPGPQTDFLRRSDDIVLFGGSKGPGKTDALLADSLAQVATPGYKALFVRRTFPQLQEIIDRAHKMLPQLGAKWNGDLRRYTFKNGSLIEFGSCDSEIDKERYQGKEYHWIGFDQLEQFTESQFNFVMAQNRTTNPNIQCFIRASANPGGIGHWWIKRRFIDGKKPNETHTIEFDHPLERGKKITRTFCYVPAKVYDNPTLLKANPQYLANLMSLPENERRAYLEGDWNAFTTDCVFDRDGMAFQEELVETPVIVGRLVDKGTEAVPDLDDKGELQIYRQPEPRARYFIFADPAYGKTSGDYSPAGVFRYGTHELVALWHGHIDPTAFGRVLYGLGMFYNWAKVAVEVRPGPGVATVGKLVEMQYPKMYRHLKWDGAKHGETGDIGWVTDEQSRQEMISAGKEMIRSKRAIVRSRIMLDELYNFIRTKAGREEAREEAHDDCVIVFCGAMRCMAFDPVGDIAGENEAPGRAIISQSVVSLPKKARLMGGRYEFAGRV